MTKVIAITNQKGGVGKTTTSINLSEGLARLNKKVLLIDLDPQGSATLSLGINRSSSGYTIYDAFTNDVKLSQMILKPKYASCSVIAANLNLAGLDVKLIDNPDRDFILSQKLEEVKKNYDYIIFDCPPSLGTITLNALYAADSCLIPVQCHFLAIDGLTQLLNTIKIVQKRKKVNNKNLNIEGILLTMLDGRVKAAWGIVNEIRDYFAEKVFKTIIMMNVPAQVAPTFGKPVIVYKPKCPASKQYKELAKEVSMNNE